MPRHGQSDAPTIGTLSDEDVQHTNEIVGRGGGGVVYKGVMSRVGKPAQEVAVKMLVPGASESDERRFLREARKAFDASESCPGACRMYGCVHRDGALCLVMRLYPRSLHAYLDERRSPDGSNYVRPLSYDEVVSFTQQILAALAQLHAKGIVVQDLKPGNVLMDESDNLVVSDFGMAAMIGSTMVTTQTTTVASGGTPAYKAPEQYDSGQFGKIGPKTDMWALGCVVIEMLTGFVPWKGTPPLEIMMNVAGKRLAPTIPQEAKGVLSAILQRCFSHEQNSRPTAQEALAMLHQATITSCAPRPTINIPERCEASVGANGGGEEEQLDLDRHQNEASPPQTQTATLHTSLLPTQPSTTRYRCVPSAAYPLHNNLHNTGSAAAYPPPRTLYIIIYIIQVL